MSPDLNSAAAGMGLISDMMSPGRPGQRRILDRDMVALAEDAAPKIKSVPNHEPDESVEIEIQNNHTITKSSTSRTGGFEGANAGLRKVRWLADDMIQQVTPSTTEMSSGETIGAERGKLQPKSGSSQDERRTVQSSAGPTGARPGRILL